VRWLAAAIFLVATIGAGAAVLEAYLEPDAPTCVELVDKAWAQALKNCYTDCRMINQGEP